MHMIFRSGIQFFINQIDVIVNSEQVAYFFRISHDKVLVPILSNLYKSKVSGIKPIRLLRNDGSGFYIPYYKLNKVGCSSVCNHIEASPHDKRIFLRTVEVLIED